MHWFLQSPCDLFDATVGANYSYVLKWSSSKKTLREDELGKSTQPSDCSKQRGQKWICWQKNLQHPSRPFNSSIGINAANTNTRLWWVPRSCTEHKEEWTTRLILNLGPLEMVQKMENPPIQHHRVFFHFQKKPAKNRSFNREACSNSWDRHSIRRKSACGAAYLAAANREVEGLF